MKKLRSQNSVFKSEYLTQQKSFQAQFKEVQSQVGDLANNLESLDFTALDRAYALKTEEINVLKLK